MYGYEQTEHEMPQQRAYEPIERRHSQQPFEGDERRRPETRFGTIGDPDNGKPALG